MKIHISILLFTCINFIDILGQPIIFKNEICINNFGIPDSFKIEQGTTGGDTVYTAYYSACVGDTIMYSLTQDSINKYNPDSVFKSESFVNPFLNVIVLDSTGYGQKVIITDVYIRSGYQNSPFLYHIWLSWKRYDSFRRVWVTTYYYLPSCIFTFKCCEGKKLPHKISASDSTLCYGESNSLIANSLYPKLRWNTGDTTASIIVSEPGLYYCIGSNVCGSDTQYVRVSRDCSCLDSFSLPERVPICSNRSVVISPLVTSPYFRYIWSTGDSSATISVRQTGAYSCTAYNDCFSLINSTVVFEALESRTVQQEFNVQYPDEVSLEACFVADRYEWVDAPDGCVSCPSVRFAPNRRLLRYTLRAFSYAGCEDSCVYIIRTFGIWGSVYVPNAFSPNGDSQNDVFEVFTNNATLHKTTIYNRWGERVFFSTDQRPLWHGTYKGSPLPAGVYVCEVVFTEADKQTSSSIKRSVTIVR